MCILDNFIFKLQEILTGTENQDDTIIRRHSRKLEQFGDIGFPLNIKSWRHLIDKYKFSEDTMETIFDYNFDETELRVQLEKLKERSKICQINVEKVVIINNDVHLSLKRSSYFLKTVITDVLNKNRKYGSSEVIHKNLILNYGNNFEIKKLSEMDLSTLRLLLIKDVSSNLVTFIANNECKEDYKIIFTLNFANQDQTSILCGPVLGKKGVKDNQTTAQDLFNKRTSDMRMMAQHKYGVQVKPSSPWKSYFEKLGRASVTIEMLSNKPHKALKLTIHDLQSANKGASFIFYNCARLAALFKELEKRIARNIYPNLPDINDVDFALLNQPEEWELFYVYILQFPILVKNCIKDIEKGILNLQYLISFLSNLSSVFSVYYRRVRILTDPRPHLFATLYARIYLLRALQCVFHNSLYLLNIEPIKEM